MITYDIDLDFRIIAAIKLSENGHVNHSDLRTKIHQAPYVLDKHLANMVKWDLITNEDPVEVGYPRKIKLKSDYIYCLNRLSDLQDAINVVNNFFGVTDTNPND